MRSKTFDEQIAERTQASMVEQARTPPAQLGAMSPEERRAMGLPDVGRERVVWGGIGWDEESGEG